MPIGRGMKVEIKETSGYGLVRITEYEVGMINYLYLVSCTVRSFDGRLRTAVDWPNQPSICREQKR